MTWQEYKVGTSFIQGPSDMAGCLPYEDGSLNEPLTNPLPGIDETENPLCESTPCQCEKTDKDNVDNICEQMFTESWLDECLAIKDPSKVIQNINKKSQKSFLFSRVRVFTYKFIGY